MSDDGELPDASDEVTTNNRRSDEARLRRQDADVVRKLMKDAPGRSWVWRLLTSCHIYESGFVAGEPDTTAFNLGERNIGNRLLTQVMDSSSDLYITMAKEARDEEARLRKVTGERNKIREGKEERSAVQYPEIAKPEGFDA